MLLVLIIRLPPRPTRTYTLFPSTPPFRSPDHNDAGACRHLHSLRLLPRSRGRARCLPLLGRHRQCADGPHRRLVVQRLSAAGTERSEEHTSELQSLMRISYAVFCLKKKTRDATTIPTHHKPLTQTGS